MSYAAGALIHPQISGTRVFADRSKNSIPRPPSTPQSAGDASDIHRWAPYAACRRADPSWFFGRESERLKEREVREVGAKKICARCSVTDLCLAWALRAGEAGVWAGTTEDERKAMQRRAASSRSKAAVS